VAFGSDLFEGLDIDTGKMESKLRLVKEVT
jgi:hypothetical protein